jgi:thymidylate synthase
VLIRPYKVSDVRDYFIGAKQGGGYGQTIDKTGVKCIELIGASFEADEDAIFGELNYEYIAKEIEWYESMSLNINDIYGESRPPPEAWKYAADPEGNINSNYGNLIFSPHHHLQYWHVVEELDNNPNSRRAMMIYNRPEIWEQFDLNGMSDFICTNAVAYYIRNGKLNCCVQMRSNDVVFGYKNDRAWQKYILNKMADELGVIPGKIIWQVMNLHVYERHFDLIKPINMS